MYRSRIFGILLEFVFNMKLVCLLLELLEELLYVLVDKNEKNMDDVSRI